MGYFQINYINLQFLSLSQ